jgi:NAD(P)H-dependent flavin oxidoreductase YrpB (nitropropane dioxygenase family)
MLSAMESQWHAYGARYPLFAFTHSAEVCAEVAKAGGIGALGASSQTPEGLDESLSWLAGHADGKPFGIDLLIPTVLGGVEDRPDTTWDKVVNAVPQGHKDFVEDLLDAHDIPKEAAPDPRAAMRSGDAPMTVGSENILNLINVALSHPEVKFVVSALGPPPARIVDMCHERGVEVGALGGSPRHAEKHVQAGLDFIVAQGTEAGGHCGEISTMVLVPQMVEAAQGRPVISAGGIGTGRQMAAAMILGASGVWCGSMWLLADEAGTEALYRESLIAAGSSDTLRSRSMTGKSCRMLKSDWTDAWEDPRNPEPLPMPLQMVLSNPAQFRIKAGLEEGRPGARALSGGIVGQIVGMLNESRPAREIFESVVHEAEDILGRFDDPRFAWARATESA